MAAKEISVKKYVVRLSGEERERVETLIRKGKSPAQRLLKARILLKADVSEGRDGWSDSQITKALETTPSMVHRVRKQLVEEGFDAVLIREIQGSGVKSLRGIARALTARGIPTARGGAWTPVQVSAILRRAGQ